MDMELEPILARMARFPMTLEALLGGLSGDEARWRPDPEAWSIVEIVDHLVDEEQADFGPRLRAVLEGGELAPIDPEAAVEARSGEERELAPALDRLAELRSRSLAWLETLTDADWSRARTLPNGSSLRAGDLLASWADHDLLHLRQIAGRLHGLVARDTRFDPGYAGGNW